MINFMQDRRNSVLFVLAILGMTRTIDVLYSRYKLIENDEQKQKLAAEIPAPVDAEETAAAVNATLEYLQHNTSNVYSFVCEHVSVKGQKNSPCHKMLYPHLKSKPAWHFLGDSQMVNLVNRVKEQYPYPISKTNRAQERCGFLNYCKMTKRDTWIPPKPTQGPIKFGLTNHFCSDLSGGDNVIYYSRTKNFMEFLVVEFASDVEQQTPITNTTQETVSIYLQKQIKDHNLVKDDSVCVANSGMHDQALCLNFTEVECFNMYINNVKRYLELLDPVCGSIVWVGSTHVLDSEEYLQENNRTILHDKGVKEILQEMTSIWDTKLFFIDVWNVSSTSVHRDYIHFEIDYYQILGSLFASLM